MATACLPATFPWDVRVFWRSVRWLGVCLLVPVLTANAGCNRQQRQVTCDLSLRQQAEGPDTTVAADPAELYIPEGAQVRIVVHNQTPTPHNFVLLQPGHIDGVLATTAPGEGKSSADMASPDVLVRGTWIPPQARQTTAFAAPPPGHYEFTCTCGTASHRRPLRGKLIVQ